MSRRAKAFAQKQEQIHASNSRHRPVSRSAYSELGLWYPTRYQWVEIDSMPDDRFVLIPSSLVQKYMEDDNVRHRLVNYAMVHIIEEYVRPKLVELGMKAFKLYTVGSSNPSDERLVDVSGIRAGIGVKFRRKNDALIFKLSL